jgi:hypothetical protein
LLDYVAYLLYRRTLDLSSCPSNGGLLQRQAEVIGIGVPNAPPKTTLIGEPSEERTQSCQRVQLGLNA